MADKKKTKSRILKFGRLANNFKEFPYGWDGVSEVKRQSLGFVSELARDDRDLQSDKLAIGEKLEGVLDELTDTFGSAAEAAGGAVEYGMFMHSDDPKSSYYDPSNNKYPN